MTDSAKPSPAVPLALPQGPVRAGFWIRGMAHFLDLVIVTFLIGLLPIKKMGLAEMQSVIFVVVAYTYFLACDFCFGRTVGKGLWGLFYAYTDGRPVPKDKLLLRSLLRIFGPFMVLSWRKTSLLDYLTGIRVFRTAKALKKEAPGAVKESRRRLTPTR